MIVAVMTCASLGHTGRPLIAPPLVTIAYLMIATAASLRTLPRPFWGMNPRSGSPGFVGLAFALLLLYYTPILTQPRADGRAG